VEAAGERGTTLTGAGGPYNDEAFRAKTTQIPVSVENHFRRLGPRPMAPARAALRILIPSTSIHFQIRNPHRDRRAGESRSCGAIAGAMVATELLRSFNGGPRFEEALPYTAESG